MERNDVEILTLRPGALTWAMRVEEILNMALHAVMGFCDIKVDLTDERFGLCVFRHS